MEKLPTELHEEILLRLRCPDRLNAALVCKRWAEIVSTSRLLRDICLVLRAADLQRATPALLDSHRQYTNLKICHGPVHTFHPEFWARIARDLVSLQLENNEMWGSGVFYAILEQCQKLQSLEITGCGRRASFPNCPQKICVAKVQQSLRNVRHLSLRNYEYLTDASLNQMLTLMPNITSLYLAECSHRAFSGYEIGRTRPDTIEFIRAVRSFQNVLDCMMRSKQKFVELDFSGTLITDEALISIVKLYRESLTSLRLDSCYQLTAEAYGAIGECSKLRLLSLHGSCQTNDDNLECILTKTPDLVHLDLGLCNRLSSQSFQLIVQLKKLRHLRLNSKQIRADSWGSLRALTELQHLNLSQTNCDVKAFRQLASLKDLRTLELGHCSNLDSECFVIICNNFKRLEKFNLEYTGTLTDEAGCKFHQLKNLRSLDITGAERISDRSLENGIGASYMNILNLGGCNLLTDRALVSIAEHHVCLEYLDLSHCKRITDSGLMLALRCLPRLRTLRLMNCRLLTDQSLFALQHHCPHLRSVNVKDCSMSDNAKDLLADFRPSLSLFE